MLLLLKLSLSAAISFESLSPPPASFLSPSEVRSIIPVMYHNMAVFIVIFIWLGLLFLLVGLRIFFNTKMGRLAEKIK